MRNNIPPALSHTPWGATQDFKEFAPGIWLLSTSSHGGFCLSDARLQSMPAPLQIETFAGRPWYEEDCDWALVVLAFPEHFDGYHLHHAISTARSFHEKVDLTDYLANHPTGRTAVTKAKDWFREHKKEWEFSGQMGGADGCSGLIVTVDRTESYCYKCENWPSLKEPFTLEQFRAAVPDLELYDSVTRTPAPAAA